jgi:hypothetical protein
MFADTVTSATGSFSAFVAPTVLTTPAWTGNGTAPTVPPGNAGTPFWNDASDDSGTGGSHLMNVGYVLTDTGGLTGTTAVLGSDTVSTDLIGTGGADPTAFNFVRNATAYNISMLFASSGLDTGNTIPGAVGTVFGYYLLSAPGTLIPVYSNIATTTSPMLTKAFNPSGNYGFYATVCYSTGATDCETYTTSAGNSGNNSGGAAWNHFALFQLASGNYVVGFTGQNGMFGEGLGDFQDVLIELSASAVPEPGTIAFLGLGLAGLGILGRRRFAKR